MDESEYHEMVASWLAESFAHVEHEPVLDSQREPDFVAHTPFESYVIEVENTFEDVFTGLGQVRYYAAETGHTPVVVLPASAASETPEFSILVENDAAPHIVTV